MGRPATLSVVAAFAAIYVFWGTTFLAIRWAVADVPPLMTIGIRCGAGGALLLVWLRLRGGWAPSSARAWARATVAGTLLFLGCHSVMATVEQRVSSGETALLMTSIPLWLVLLDSLRRRIAPPPLVVIGLLVGAAGVALLTGSATLSGGRAGDRLALVLCALSWAVGSLVARDGERPASAVQATAMQLLSGGVVVAAFGALSSERARWAAVHLTARAGWALVFLVLCGTVLGMASYTWLLRVTSPAAVGTYAFVNPVIALLLGRAVGDDQLGPRTLAAAALVVAGVVLLQRATRGSAGPKPARDEAGAPPGVSTAGARVTTSPEAETPTGSAHRGISLEAQWPRMRATISSATGFGTAA